MSHYMMAVSSKYNPVADQLNRDLLVHLSDPLPKTEAVRTSLAHNGKVKRGSAFNQDQHVAE